jgi:ribosomal protein L11 methyltransferase
LDQQGTGKADRIWYALDIAIALAAREAVEYALMEAGALGTELSEEAGERVLVTGYFPSNPELELVRAELVEALRIYDLQASAVGEIQVREVADEDWLGEWKKTWQPVEVGRFIIAPPWSDVKPLRDRILIRIEPGMAFGTGTHETTRLCLKAITRFFKGGSFLDVGTGSGILAIAAAKSFPLAKIEACDTDPEAISIARENARLNEVAEQVNFRTGSLEESSTASADFVCANLTAAVITSLLPELVNASCGRLVLSGILDSQVDSVVDGLHALGASGNFVMMQEGEWVALIV